MPIDERWSKLSPGDWEDFAKAWLADIRSDADSDVQQSVIMMHLSATPDAQWTFILEAVKHATTDKELAFIAAGPVEHLLGHHGSEYIDEIERRATPDSAFGRMLTAVWKYQMSDDLWARVQALQARVENPLA
ncbi:MAG: hypothetical protein R3B72_29650 [Polyangiaceae bacterium]